MKVFVWNNFGSTEVYNLDDDITADNLIKRIKDTLQFLGEWEDNVEKMFEKISRNALPELRIIATLEILKNCGLIGEEYFEYGTGVYEVLGA